MTIQDFIAVWQAQPFRAFRVHTARGVFAVEYPLAASVLPPLRIAVVAAEAGTKPRVEVFPLEEIRRLEPFGPPCELAQIFASVPPEVLARDAQLLAAAAGESAAEAAADDGTQAGAAAFDAGTVSLLAGSARTGEFTVHATIETRDGAPLFSTVGTRWNLHGLERFENGTSLFLHHPDHPHEEQRIIVWPPDRGTFESFAEAKSPGALRKELEKRDVKLVAKPAKPFEPAAGYFQSLAMPEPLPPPSAELDRDGEPLTFDPERHRLELDPLEIAPAQWINLPRIHDLERGTCIFDLRETSWDAEVEPKNAIWSFTLRQGGDDHPDHVVQLEIDVWTRWARLANETQAMPLEFTERHLLNFALHRSWEDLFAALRAGPRDLKTPDLRLSFGIGYAVELWRGNARGPRPPFLQPRVLDPRGRPLLDLRETVWAASVRPEAKQPRMSLRLFSNERDRDAAEAALAHVVTVDLEARRVVCPSFPGSTSLGMFDALLRRVRTTKWLLEALPELLAKGRELPVPEGLKR